MFLSSNVLLCINNNNANNAKYKHMDTSLVLQASLALDLEHIATFVLLIFHVVLDVTFSMCQANGNIQKI